MDFLPDKSIMCHHTGFTKSCRSIVSEHTCPKFCHLIGTDPQTGQQIDRYGCIDGQIPHLLLEIAQQVRQAGAATESARNEIAKLQQRLPQEGAFTLIEQVKKSD